MIDLYRYLGLEKIKRLLRSESFKIPGFRSSDLKLVLVPTHLVFAYVNYSIEIESIFL